MTPFFWESRRLLFLVLVSIIVISITGFTISAPRDFPIDQVVVVEAATPLAAIAALLEDKSVIRSSSIFRVFLKVTGRDTQIKAGEYIFEAPLGMITVLDRLLSADYRIPRKEVILWEGLSRSEMANVLSINFANFDSVSFLHESEELEGFLFPDTYTFPINATYKQILDALQVNFDRQIIKVSDEIKSSGRSLNEIITMASLIEKEASDPEDKRLISGILWKRLDIDMPLQVDAVFVFLIGKGSSKLTAKDLGLDSPYNTYKNKGLPPGPIANPGLDSIRAALEPTQSKYLYYLADLDGITHYGATFEEHKDNKRKYLGK